jgi:hypothetical protein
MFSKLCGDDPLRNVILATTMWDRVQKIKGEERQKELEGKYWKEMRDHGSQTRRFDGTPVSAWNIIDAIPKKTIGILLLQEELVDLKRQLSETQAGIALYDQLQKLLAEHKETLRKLREEAVGNNDEQLTQALNAEYDMVQRKLQGTFEQITGLKLSWTRRLTLLFSRKSQTVCSDSSILFSATTDRLSRHRKCAWAEVPMNVCTGSFRWRMRGCNLCPCISQKIAFCTRLFEDRFVYIRMVLSHNDVDST